MDLWIRSQDKQKLLKPVSMSLNNDKKGIYGYYNDDYYEVLGRYKTEERALEVLDEIQSKLTSNKIIMQLDRGTHVRQEDVDIFYNKFDIKLLPAGADLKSIPKDIVIYEMPEK